VLSVLAKAIGSLKTAAQFAESVPKSVLLTVRYVSRSIMFTCLPECFIWELGHVYQEEE